MSFLFREQLAAPGNYGGSRTASQIQYLIIHYTGNDGDNAASNAAYYHNTVVEASAHYFVDDTTVYRSVPDLKVAWAVGGKKYASAERTGGGTMYGIITNTNSLSIELCDTVKDSTYQASNATISNAIKLCVELMAKYDIPIENVYRHFDVTGKLCPIYMVDTDRWTDFKDKLQQRAADNIPASYAKDAVKWIQDEGIMTGNADGNLMLTQPLTRQQFAVMLHRYHTQNGKLPEPKR